MKGIAYILEAILSIFVLLAFSVGVLNVTGAEHNWNDYRAEIAAEDLSYSLSQTGDLQTFMGRGDSGAFQTAVGSITEQNYQISSRISGLPSFDLRASVLVEEEEQETVTDFGSLSEDLECSEDQLSPAFDLSEDISVDNDRFSGELYLGVANTGESQVFLNLGDGCDLSTTNIHEESEIFEYEDSQFYIDEILLGSQNLQILDVSVYEDIRSAIESSENSVRIDPHFSYSNDEADIDPDDLLLTKRDSPVVSQMIRFNIESAEEILINPYRDREASRLESLQADYGIDIINPSQGSLGERTVEITVPESNDEYIRMISASVLWVSIGVQNIENDQFTRTNLDREINTEIVGSLDSEEEAFIPYVINTRWGY